MSICPTKDIHSVYIDNELPANFKTEYENHIKTCPKCQKELQSLRNLKALFEQDSKAINVDNNYLNQSFERLQLKMKYSKTTNHTSAFQSHINIKNITYFASSIAAALVFALIIPIGISKNKTTPTQPNTTNNISTITFDTPSLNQATMVSFGRNETAPFANERGVLISGNIDRKNLSNKSSSRFYNNNAKHDMISNVEVFRPDFNEDETISIKLKVPNIDNFSESTDIKLPIGRTMDY